MKNEKPKKAIPDEAEVLKLKKELIDVLQRINTLAPLKFHDNDCDDVVFNFGDLAYDRENHEMHVDIYMWENKLPKPKTTREIKEPKDPLKRQSQLFDGGK